MNTTDNLPILREENIQTIIAATPEAFDTNSRSLARASEAGQQLLDEISAHGMSDDLDRRCAEYIDKARRTLRTMNLRRTPFTKLCDQIRSEFTSMENAVDPSKKDSIPFRIQAQRNAYAAHLREIAERQRQEEIRRQQHQQALINYRQDTEEDFRRQFNNLVTTAVDTLTALDRSLTLDNFDNVCNRIRNFDTTLRNEWFQNLRSDIPTPPAINADEADTIRRETLNRLSVQFKEQYRAETEDYRDNLVDTLPARRRELQQLADADAAEQARLKAELEARQAAEQARLEDARRQKAQEEAAAKAVQQSAATANSLFAVAATATADYQPKTSVKKRIVITAPDGILDIILMWWTKEGKNLSIDELTKTFRKQITLCERLANDRNNPEFITSASIVYQDEVKAK